MKKQNDSLKQYEEAVEHMTRYFIKKYFKKDLDYYWVADCIGTVMSVGDYFFGLQDIADFLKYRYSEKDMFEYYDKNLEFAMKDKNALKKVEYFPNIENWKHIRKMILNTGEPMTKSQEKRIK
jgi:hypothetical protein